MSPSFLSKKESGGVTSPSSLSKKEPGGVTSPSSLSKKESGGVSSISSLNKKESGGVSSIPAPFSGLTPSNNSHNIKEEASSQGLKAGVSRPKPSLSQGLKGKFLSPSPQQDLEGVPLILRTPTTPRQVRKDLTISTLIAECEEYVQTDKFTRDLSSDLVNLFKGKQDPRQSDDGQYQSSDDVKKVICDSEVKKPPKIPQSMRTKQTVERAERLEKVSSEKHNGDREKRQTGKFPGKYMFKFL